LTKKEAKVLGTFNDAIITQSIYKLHRCKSNKIANPNKKLRNQNAKKNMRKKIHIFKKIL
jgi:hypothetical protein